MKKTLTALLVVTLALFLVSCSKQGSDNAENNDKASSLAQKHTYVSGICTICGSLKPSEGFEFRPVLDDSGKTVAYAVSGMGNCTDTSLVFPDTHENLPVVKVLYGGFENIKDITDITLPLGYTAIESGAFRGCENLNKVTLPLSLETVEGFAFQNCTSLTEINLPEGVKILGKQSFSGCKNLTNVTFPSTLEEIDYMAFMDCTKLDKVFLNEGLKKIGDYAFESCENIYDMTLPKSLEFIGAGAFDGCISLINQKYSGTVAEFKEIELGGGINNENPILCSDGSIKRLYSNYDKEVGRW